MALELSRRDAATLERVQPEMFKYEHIARAALGSAMAAGLRGSDVEAMRWLRALAEAPALPPAVRDQLFARRMAVLGAAKRWNDLDVEVRKARKSDREGGGQNVEPLSASSARLLAVLTLEADRRIVGDVLDRLARVALADLTARGEISQVLDLVQRYGTAPIGEDGFIVNFVRGAQTYEQARTAHKEAAPSSADEPCTVDAIITQYKQAAALLEAGLRQPDAASFGAERARAARYLGLALFYAGDFMSAADAFSKPRRTTALRDEAEESMWLAISALDPRLANRCCRRLAAARRDRSVVPPDLRRFGAIGQTAGLGGCSRDHRRRRRHQDTAWGFPNPRLRTPHRAVRPPGCCTPRTEMPDLMRETSRPCGFLSVAEELLAVEKKAAIEAADAQRAEAGERVVTRARQMLDASLRHNIGG